MPLQPVPMNISGGIGELAIGAPGRRVASDDTGRSLTAAALNDRVNRLANALLDRGVRPGDPVAVLLRNRLEYVEVWGALGRAGMPVVPVDPRYRAPEVDYVVEHSAARALIVESALAEVGAHAAETIDGAILQLDGDEVGEPYEHALAGSSGIDRSVAVSELDPCAILYTGGTTGRPKGVLTSHRSRCLSMFCMALEFGLGPNRGTVVVVPMYNGGGLVFGYGALHTGGRLHIMTGSFDPEALMATVERERPSAIFLVPTQLQMLRSLGEGRLHSYDTSSLRNIFLNAAPTPQELKEWFVPAFPGIGMHEMYGSTEGGVISDLRPPDQLRKVKCVGPPWFMTEVRILDPGDRSPLPPGEPGELFSRSPFLMNGYLKAPELTEASTTDDGFLTVGDIAVMDEDDYLYIVGRTKDMIISGGFNVYPREVEEVLLRHPAVHETTVFGVPDEKWGERVVAAAILVPGTTPTVYSLLDHCRRSLAGYKVPKDVMIIRDFPRNPMGKVLKDAVRSEYLQSAEDPKGSGE